MQPHGRPYPHHVRHRRADPRRLQRHALAAIFTQNVSAQFLGGFLDAEDTSVGMFTETDVPNFLANERAIYGKMGQLHKLGKGGTAKDLDTRDWNEVYKIFRYAGKFVIDEQDFINDRFGAGADVAAGHGLDGPPDPRQPPHRALLQPQTQGQAWTNSGVTPDAPGQRLRPGAEPGQLPAVLHVPQQRGDQQHPDRASPTARAADAAAFQLGTSADEQAALCGTAS